MNHICLIYLNIWQVTGKWPYLESTPQPKHWPVEVQSSDKGPGVGSNEHLVQIRMAETFQIYIILICKLGSIMPLMTPEVTWQKE